MCLELEFNFPFVTCCTGSLSQPYPAPPGCARPSALPDPSACAVGSWAGAGTACTPAANSFSSPFISHGEGKSLRQGVGFRLHP